MNTFNLRLDLDKAPTLPLWVTIRQGDKNGTTISASIYDHGTLLAGSYNARIAFQLPDGEHYYRKDATFSSGVATVTIDETEAASVTGNTVGYFEILSGTTVIASTASFGIHVLQSATEGMTPGENYDTAIQEAIDGLNEAVAELPDTVEGILEEHPEWTTTVQDGSISVPKLASEVRSSLSGAILAAIGGTLVTAHDAAAVPPNAASVFGRSAQSDTPTPSSPVAITSVTAAELGFAGVNLLPRQCSTQTINGVTFTVNADGSVHAQGTASANAVFYYTPDTTLVGSLPVGTLTFSGCPAGGGASTWKLDFRYQTTPSPSGGSFITDYGSGATFTHTQVAYINITRIVVYSGATINATFRPQINLGSTATPYTPYVGSTLAIDLQGHELRSLPDGTRDELVVGADGHAVLVQRVGSVTFDGSSDESWSAYTATTHNRIATGVLASLVRKPSGNNVLVSMLCSQFESKTASSVIAENTGIGVTSTGSLTLYHADYQTASAWKAHLAESPMTLLYPLATPTTIDLGYVTLPTLPAPDLTAWAAQGAELAVTYQRDATLVIAGIYAQLAPVDGPTATSNHGVGTYLMLGDTLCKVTTAIAAGETIAIGTNVVATTVMTEILALTA